MSEMVERVAAAIANYWLEIGFDPSLPDEGAARAAIQAMREPTDAMKIAALDATFDVGDVPIIWQAMIDAALKENSSK